MKGYDAPLKDPNMAGIATGWRPDESGASSPSGSTPQIAVQLEILNKELTNQRDTVERLSIRLQPAMSQRPPQAGEIGRAGNEPTCEIAGHIANLGRVAAENTALIENLLSRLEV